MREIHTDVPNFEQLFNEFKCWDARILNHSLLDMVYQNLSANSCILSHRPYRCYGVEHESEIENYLNS